jgi:CheY-specific phosphatase CheX
LDALLEVAAREVFELMLGCKLSLAAGDEKENLNVTSMVGLAGQLCGVLSVRCDNKAAALMASKMLGVDLDKVGPEVSGCGGGAIFTMSPAAFSSRVRVSRSSG